MKRGMTLLLLIALALASDAFAQGDAALGKRLYRQGLTGSGESVRAVMQGDIAVDGAHLNCATCHRRSGFGASEGAAIVPPITAAALYRPRDLNRADLFRKMYQDVQPNRRWARARDPRVRPAYTDAALRLALRQGQDPSGRVLDPLMPRYQLSAADLENLIAYLKTLAAEPAPGVNDEAIHFATVIAPGAPAPQRQAMLGVMRAYLRRKNADTEAKRRHAGFSLYYKDEFAGAYRTWNLHVWELSGTASTWGAQLDAYYRAQPVFAVLSGIVPGAWRPVREFCEAAEVPCLFPYTDLPVIAPDDAFTFYFAEGLPGEAKALAHHLAATWGGPVAQVYRNDARGRIPAQALRQAMGDKTTLELQDYVIDDTIPSARFWLELAQQAPAAWVLWLAAADVNALIAAVPQMPHLPRLYLPSRLMSAPWPPPLREQLRFAYPYALPHHTLPRRYRVRAWLRSRGLALTHEPTQLNTYFTLSVVDHALTHLVEHFSREYFMESIEHETENALNPGIYPHLSLGPGQRFASKGSYIVKLAADGGVQAVSEWIAP